MIYNNNNSNINRNSTAIVNHTVSKIVVSYIMFSKNKQ